MPSPPWPPPAPAQPPPFAPPSPSFPPMYPPAVPPPPSLLSPPSSPPDVALNGTYLVLGIGLLTIVVVALCAGVARWQRTLYLRSKTPPTASVGGPITGTSAALQPSAGQIADTKFAEAVERSLPFVTMQ